VSEWKQYLELLKCVAINEWRRMVGGFKSSIEMYKAYMFPEIDKVIQEIENAEGADAAEWVRQMLDPLHHKIMGRTPVGPPSKTREPVLVFADTVVIPIAIPSSFDPTLPWSFQAQFFPDTYAQEYNLYNRDQNLLSLLAGSLPVRYGGIIINARQGTTNIQWSLPPALQVLIAQWSVGDALTNVKSKTMVVSLKIENNTPPLYAGGATHAARHNEGNSERTTNYFIQNLTGGSTANVQCTEEFSYPSSPQEIAFLPGYMDGDAIDGSMNVCCADVWEEAAVPDYTHTVFESNIPVAEPNTSNVIGPVVRNSTLDADWGVPVYWNLSSGLKPMQQWYVNVTPQSTFTARIDAISAAFYAPNIPGQLQNISLLRQSTPYCPKAMNLVSLLLRQAPAMGKAADNRNFSWLKKVMADSRGDVSDILGMIPHPIAQGAGMIWDAFKPKMVQANMGTKLGSGNPTMPQPRNLTRAQNIHGPFAAAKYPQKTVRPKPVQQVYQTQVRTMRPPPLPTRNYASYESDKRAVLEQQRKLRKREKRKLRRRANSY